MIRNIKNPWLRRSVLVLTALPLLLAAVTVDVVGVVSDMVDEWAACCKGAWLGK